MSGGGASRGSCSMVWWDMETVQPATDCQLLEHLLALHQATSAGLFSLCAPVKVCAHGTAPLADGAHECIARSGLLLQQSISCGVEYGSSWKAMVIDVLLWATDHAPAAADMIVVSRVLDRSLADVIHQLYTRSYNVIVVTAFPPKLLTPLRQFVPPLTLLRQIFHDWGSRPVTHKEKYEEPLGRKRKVSSGNNAMPSLGRAAAVTEIAESASGNNISVMSMKDFQLASVPVAVFNPVPASTCDLIVPIMMKDCKTLVHEFLARGKVAFKVQEIKEQFKMRFGYRLDNKAAGYIDIVKLLQDAMPNEVFTGVYANLQLVIQCKASSVRRCNPTLPLAKTTPTVPLQTPQVSETGITIGEVRAWLEELASSGRAAWGINLSQLGMDFEIHRGKKLDYKILGQPSLKNLLLRFPDLLHLQRRRDNSTILFPTTDHGSRKRARTSAPPESLGRLLPHPRSLLAQPGLSRDPSCNTLIPNQTCIKMLQVLATTIPRTVIQAAQHDTRSSIAMSTSIPEPATKSDAVASTGSPVVELQAEEGSKVVRQLQDVSDDVSHVDSRREPFGSESSTVTGECEEIKRTFQSMSRLLDEEMERVNCEFDRITQSL